LAAWWHACRIETVAMESTGVDGMPVYEILEARGFQGSLVNARPLKHGPGRKTAVKDGQGIQSLPTCGLLSASVRPEAAMGAWRASWRHRATGLDDRAAPIQHRQQALPQMNVQVPQGLTAITDTTGRASIRAIVAGERAPVHLARFRDPRCAHSAEAIAKALTGHDRAEPVLALQQARALYDVSTAQVRACEAAIARHLQAITPVWDDDLPPLDRQDQALSHRQNAPADEARSLRDQLTGVDWVAIPGLHASTGPTMIAAIGLNLGKWPHKACGAWRGLAPCHEIAGGNVVRRSTLKTRNRAGQAWR
jgi:transposase